ncbi:nitrogenase-stabilizing/protective protein NifW [Kamptonema formosum]|uniref:nitrogenase-stabilizing/protective protein NifW n=1 Tax=Kamptonema formosum TaxID=331992 RepID=UPI0003461393|nr:nitrogenase-stabilizing/protective protein NifW [Oscillatoria sp. PCC 10802]
MTLTLSAFKLLVNAEEYFEFFGLPYDQQFVNVNRLHILKKFSQFIDEINSNTPEASESEKLSLYQQALQQAYELFQSSTPVEQKLFKVFNEKPANVVLLTDIKTE